jgi:hypothetical protein
VQDVLGPTFPTKKSSFLIPRRDIQSLKKIDLNTNLRLRKHIQLPRTNNPIRRRTYKRMRIRRPNQTHGVDRVRMTRRRQGRFQNRQGLGARVPDEDLACIGCANDIVWMEVGEEGCGDVRLDNPTKFSICRERGEF